MDGVLVDFDGRCEELDCRPAGNHSYGSVDWEKVKAIGPDFWATMEWLPGSQEMFTDMEQFCRDNGIQFGILTAISIPCGVKGKSMWVHWNTDLDMEHLIIVPHGIDKQRFSAPGRVLLDDHELNVGEFTDRGGLGILFKDCRQALADMKAAFI